MTRYNIFNQVHKGLRALLYDTILKLQQTDFTVPDDAEEALAQVQIVIDLFDSHAHTEDQFILPAIAAFEPYVVETFEQEHVHDLALSSSLSGNLQAFALAVSPDAKRQIGASICESVWAFALFNLNHMKKEEDILNKILRRHYDDHQLHGITQQILAQVPPQKMQLYSRWMLRGLSNTEIILWFRQVKTNAPAAIFESLAEMAENELPEHRWQLIMEALTEGAMLA